MSDAPVLYPDAGRTGAPAFGGEAVEADGAVHLRNAAWAGAAPVLSVLTPFFRHDPAPLLRRLETEAAALDGRVEIVLLDDANPEPAFSASAQAAALASPLPVQLIRLARNEGRCRGRNRLAAAARARHFLFLDSDMAPDHADFLGRWVRLIAAEDPACAVGGFTLKQTVVARAHALHAAMQERAECVPASVRRLRPEKYVYTSNMLVRRDVFAAEAFDEGFSGWGWEDVEWGMRVAARFGVVHIENAASHLGLDTAPALAEKYRQSAANFARALAKHPQIVRTYPSYRTARLIRRLPGHGALAAPLRRLALAEAAPLPLRVLALKLHRAALYAQVI